MPTLQARSSEGLPAVNFAHAQPGGKGSQGDLSGKKFYDERTSRRTDGQTDVIVEIVM